MFWEFERINLRGYGERNLRGEKIGEDRGRGNLRGEKFERIWGKGI